MTAMRWHVAPGVLHRVVGDEVFVLMPDARIHWLKRPAAQAIWALVAGPESASTHDLDTLVATLMTRFDGSADAIRADTLAFLSDLEQRGALVRTDS